MAAQHALDTLGLSRVMVLDWDVHHGNGTSDIFHSSDQVLFVSLGPSASDATLVIEAMGLPYEVRSRVTII